MKVAEKVLERMAQAGDAEAQRRTGLDVALEMIAAVRDRTQGVQVSVPFGRVEGVKELVEAVKG